MVCWTTLSGFCLKFAIKPLTLLNFPVGLVYVTLLLSPSRGGRNNSVNNIPARGSGLWSHNYPETCWTICLRLTCWWWTTLESNDNFIYFTEQWWQLPQHTEVDRRKPNSRTNFDCTLISSLSPIYNDQHKLQQRQVPVQHYYCPACHAAVSVCKCAMIPAPISFTFTDCCVSWPLTC